VKTTTLAGANTTLLSFVRTFHKSESEEGSETGRRREKEEESKG
jgi:hypothetical protein